MADEAKRKRTAAKSQFTRAESSLKNALSLENCAKWTIENRYSEIKRRWDNVQEAHDNYVSLIDEEALPAEEEWIAELMNRFEGVELDVGEHMKPVIKTEPVKEMSMKKSIFKVDSIKFQTFSGDIRKYPSFRYEFKTHIVPRCERGQEVLVLKAHLSDDIKEEIMNIGDNPADVWARLDSKYGRVDRIIEHVLRYIKGLARSEDSGDILYMISIVEKAYRDLKNLGEEREMQNSSILSDIEGAMSSQMRFEWVKLIANETLGSNAKCAKLNTFLQEWRNRLEYDGAVIRAGTPTSGNSFHVEQRNRNLNWKTKSCWLHNDQGGDPGSGHPIWLCKLFLSKPIAERIRLVGVNNACKRCLDVGCTGSTDISKFLRRFTCSIEGCGEIHNKLLHITTAGTTFHASNEAPSSSSEAALPIQTTD